MGTPGAADEGPGCGMLYVPDILQGQSGTTLTGLVLSDFLEILVLSFAGGNESPEELPSDVGC